MKYEAIFFDWDGVITDSVSVKTEAFSEMFKEYGPDVQEKVRSHHLRNGGMSRFDKFRIYYHEFLGIVINDEKVQELAERFSTLVKDKVIKAPFIPGALETITAAYQEGTKLFVISGTPTGELKEIVEAKGLKSYFCGIGGTPSKKTDWVNYFCVNHHLDRKKCLLVGDALVDYNAAKVCGIDFIAIKIPGCKTDFPEDTLIREEVKLCEKS